MTIPYPPALIAFIGGAILYFVTTGKASEAGKLVMFAGILAILLRH
jgi:hypothetical protein